MFFDQREPGFLHRRQRFFFRDGVFARTAKINDDQSPLRFEGPAQVGEVGHAIFDVLQHVTQKDNVHRLRREQRIIWRHKARFVLLQAAALRIQHHRANRRRINVEADGFARGADGFGEATREEAIARADVRDDLPGAHAHRLQNLSGLALIVAGRERCRFQQIEERVFHFRDGLSFRRDAPLPIQHVKGGRAPGIKEFAERAFFAVAQLRPRDGSVSDGALQCLRVVIERNAEYGQTLFLILGEQLFD